MTARELAQKIHARCERWSRSQHTLSGEDQIAEIAAILEPAAERTRELEARADEQKRYIDLCHERLRERDEELTLLRKHAAETLASLRSEGA